MYITIVQHIQLGRIANNSIMQIVIVSPNRKMHKKKKESYGDSHPPLYCNEEEVEEFGSWNRIAEFHPQPS